MLMVKLVKVTDDRRVYIGKDGNEHSSSNVFAEIVINGNIRRFAIKNCFGNDRALLDLAIDDFVHLGKYGKPIEKPSK